MIKQLLGGLMISLLFTIFLWSCQSNGPKADLIVINADIWTGQTEQPQITAFAVKDGKFVKIGNNEEVLKWKGEETEVLDAQQQFITPGFIDSHVHFITGGLNLASVQLRYAKTPEDFSQRIGDFASGLEKGAWITGGEWDHEQWGGELPTRAWIDQYTPDHPVFVQRLDGHMGLANSLALQLAGVDENTPSVDGGEIIKDDNGQPTGLLKDNAMGLVHAVIPAPGEKELERALNASMKYVASNGVTSIHHVGGTAPEGYLKAFGKARDNGTLITRIYAMMPLSQWPILQEKIEKEGRGDEWLKIGGLKGFVDGSLGSHTAAFHDPYTDQPSDRGIYVNDRDSLTSWIKGADEAGLQVAVHAIGDEAIHFILNTFEATQKANGAKDRRFRVEHAQHIAPDDISRFGTLGVIPSMQPYHAIDDGRWAEKVIGSERIKTTYAFKSLFENGATVAFGSDWFVAPPTPLEGIYAAVTRRTLDDKNPSGWVPEQKISVEQALIGYTVNAAYASFDEDLKGTIEEGKLADFVMLDKSLFKVAPEEIRNVKVLKTYVGGKMVHEAK